MSKVMIVFLAVLYACSAAADDLFVGVFKSETRENFGSDKFGAYRIEIAAAADGKYLATMYKDEMVLITLDLVKCPVDHEDYLNNRPPGRAQVLCPVESNRIAHGFISFAENGISVTRVKEKYVKNPELVQKEELKPGDPSLFEPRHYTTQYYAHAQWAFYGFRKVSP